MNRFATSGLALALAGTMIGCAPRYADVPAPTRFENSTQQKLQAAQHWQAIADHFAQGVAEDLRKRGDTRSLYVPTPDKEQPFVAGFRELLTTALVAQGLPVSVDSRSALTVDVRYSIYAFSPDRAKNTYYYGEASALGAGLWALSAVATADISSSASLTAGVKVLTAALGVEGFAWLSQEGLGNGRYASGPVPRSEILLTASIHDGSRIVSRRSNIYYAADEDRALYWPQPSPPQPHPGYAIKVLDCAEGSKPCAR